MCLAAAPPRYLSQVTQFNIVTTILLCQAFGTVIMGAAASASTKGKPVSAEDEIKHLQKEVSLLKKKLEAVKVQKADVCQQNDRLRSKVSKLEAQLLAAPPNPSLSHATFAKCSAGIVSGKNRRDDKYLRDLFSRHKNASGGLSGQSLVQALQDVEAPNIPTSDPEVEAIIKQFDANSNGVLEFGEFQQVANEPDELQWWLGEKQLPIAADALRPLVGRGSDQLQKFSQLSAADIDHAAGATCAIIPSMLKELHQELQAAFAVQLQVEADMKADPSKFNDFYKMACGTITDFHKGLTGRVGMPHLNFKNAMRQEHCERAGCDVQFTTGNYKITTTPRKEWQYIVDSVTCPDMGHKRRLVPISELLQLDSSKTAKLCEEEVIAIVLYTGPMFQIYNTILRRYPKEKFELFEKGDNQFSTTIFVLVSAVQKLSRFTRIPLGTLLYRGLGGRVDLPDIFFQIDDKGCSGYAEWGFLSTTSDRDVALGYSGVKERRPKAMVMVIETSSIDRGADISEFSQYPGEKEFLYLPCSFLQRTRQGYGRAQVVDGGLVAFVSVRINLNIKTQTVEELQEQKKSLHMVSAKSILPDVQFAVTEFLQDCKQQGIDLTQYVGNVQNFVYETIVKCHQVVQSHEHMDAKDFTDDEISRRLITEVLDVKADAMNAIKWQQLRLQLRSHGFVDAACVDTLRGHSSTVFTVAFHPNAPILATGSADRTVKLWRIAPGESSATCVVTLEGKSDYDLGHANSVQAIAFHPTAPILATCSDDNTAKLWRFCFDKPSATCTATLKGHNSGVSSVAFHPNAPILATGSQDGSAKLWRISPDESSATCVATLSGKSKYDLGHDDSIWSVAFHPTAPILATCSSDKTAKLWRFSFDYSSATCLATLEGHNQCVSSVAFHPNAPILATGSQDGTAKLWRIAPDESSATCVATLNGDKAVDSVAFHPLLPILATGGGFCVQLWRISLDQSSTTPVAILKGHGRPIRSVAFHPSAPILASSSVDGTAKLWF
jgi:WD40 repeat protein